MQHGIIWSDNLALLTTKIICVVFVDLKGQKLCYEEILVCRNVGGSLIY
jgi:hypothetical protein